MRPAHQQVVRPAESPGYILTRTQIVVALDGHAGYRWFLLDLAARDFAFQLRPFLAMLSHTLVALVLRAKGWYESCRRVQPLPTNRSIKSAKLRLLNKRAMRGATYSCGTVLPSTPRNLSSFSWLQGPLSNHDLMSSGDMGFASKMFVRVTWSGGPGRYSMTLITPSLQIMWK